MLLREFSLLICLLGADSTSAFLSKSSGFLLLNSPANSYRKSMSSMVNTYTVQKFAAITFGKVQKDIFFDSHPRSFNHIIYQGLGSRSARNRCFAMSGSSGSVERNNRFSTLTKDTEWKLTLSLTGPPQDGQFGPGNFVVRSCKGFKNKVVNIVRCD